MSARTATALLVVGLALGTAREAVAQSCGSCQSGTYCCGGWNSGFCVPEGLPACFPRLTPTDESYVVPGLYCSEGWTPCDIYKEESPSKYFWGCCGGGLVCTSHCGSRNCWPLSQLVEPCEPEPPCDDCDEFAHPISGSNGASSLTSIDVKIPGALGGIELKRRWTSSPLEWKDDAPFHTVPKPFGGYGAQRDLPEWTHNALAVVTIANVDNVTRWSVRKPGGKLRLYVPCSGTPCWAAPTAGNFSTQDRLLRTSSGFELLQPDGERLVFEARYVQHSYGFMLDGGPVPQILSERYFLSRIVNSAGVTALAASYQLPSGLSCFQESADAGTAVGVPYLYQLSSPEAAIRFGYVSLPSFSVDGGLVTDAGSECVIRNVYAVNLADAGIASTLATYTYFNDGVTERPGRIVTAALAGRTEAYSYSSTFTESLGGTVVSTHSYTDGKVTSDVTLSENLSVSWSVGATQVCNEFPVVAAVASASARSGDGSSAAAGLTSVYLSLANNGQQHQPRRYQQTDSCSVAGACSPGTSRTEWTCSTPTAPGYEKAVKNKRDNWEAYTWAAVDAGFTFPVLEKRGLARGATDMNGTSALENESYGYVYDAGQQLLSTTTKGSVLSSGNNAFEQRWYEQNNRLWKVTKKGYTRDFATQSVQQKVVATFYSTSRSCGASAGPDALGRTLQVSGPCFVSSETASSPASCIGAYPVTVYEYWAANETTLGRANRLKAVRRYVDGSACTGTVLSTQYDDYDALGNARSVTDEAGNVTTYTFDGAGQVLSRAKGGNTTSFAYDNGKLFKVTYPGTNVELFCYRTGTNATCTSGAWTPQLQWKAKANAGGQWAELIAYTYAADGTVSREDYRSCPAGTCTGPSGGELRRVMKYDADAHRRPTWRQVGDNAGKYTATSFFDRADNLAGVGLPFNNTPAFCGGPQGGAPDEPVSTLCARLKYDRAERLSSFTEYPTGAGGSAQATCFGYDGQGNVTAVTQGCTTTCSSNGTCSGSSLASTIEYSWDDFGNLVMVQAPWTSGSGSSGKGIATSYFDALGNVTREQNAEQYALSPTQNYTETVYDMLSRPTLKRVSEGGTLSTLWTLAYDGTTTPTNCPGIFNTGGRLSSRTDGYGQTFYSYDVEGRVTKEVRIRAGNSACTGTGGKDPFISPHTFYSYDSNGNVTSIEYPHGRTVTYYYGAGGNADRAFQLWVTPRWSGSSWGAQVRGVYGALWEPYGGLRSYQVLGTNLTADAGGATFTVEYLQGDNGAVRPATPCSALPPDAGGADFTGRLRALFVSRDDGGTTGLGDVYRRWYTYQGDVPLRIESCALNETSPRIVEYGYDKTLRVASVDGGYPAGPTGVLSFTYDSRGNRTASTASGQPSQLSTTNTIASAGTLSQSARSDNLQRDYVWDRAGRPHRDGGIAFGPNGAGARRHVFDYSYGAGVTFKAFGSDGLWWNYSYDAFNRRVVKQPPNGLSELYFYDLGHQLLADEGFGKSTTRVVHDYVWLGGRPVLVARSAYVNGVPQSEYSAQCNRSGGPAGSETSSCGFYAPVTDALGAPVAMLDSKAYLTGVNDAEPFGYPNRGVLTGTTGQPYLDNQSSVPFASFSVTSTGAGTFYLTGQARAKAAVLELNDTGDFVTLDCGSGSGGGLNGASRPAWTLWTSIASTCSLKFSSNASGHTAGGVVAEAFEYRRYDSRGPGAFFTPLRFPGQYHDAETDLFENWNRYYDPFSGRYLQPEPVLHDPKFVRGVAKDGHSVPTYSYAANNPIAAHDNNGLYVVWTGFDADCPNYKRALEIAREKAGCVPSKPDCECQKLLAKCTKGDNICEVLEPGKGPWISNIRAGGPNYGRAQPIWHRLHDLDFNICHMPTDWFVEQLARTLLHEGAHLTSRWRWRVAPDDPSSECDAQKIEDACFK